MARTGPQPQRFVDSEQRPASGSPQRFSQTPQGKGADLSALQIQRARNASWGHFKVKLGPLTCLCASQTAGVPKISIAIRPSAHHCTVHRWGVAWAKSVAPFVMVS